MYLCLLAARRFDLSLMLLWHTQNFQGYNRLSNDGGGLEVDVMFAAT